MHTQFADISNSVLSRELHERERNLITNILNAWQNKWWRYSNFCSSLIMKHEKRYLGSGGINLHYRPPYSKFRGRGLVPGDLRPCLRWLCAALISKERVETARRGGWQMWSVRTDMRGLPVQDDYFARATYVALRVGASAAGEKYVRAP